MKQDLTEIELTLLHTNDMHGSVAGIARAARLARDPRRVRRRRAPLPLVGCG
jgi:2',3'-cyclic-nucleotide 2'-phosphodiesterase (5'-nucleotidase family)